MNKLYPDIGRHILCNISLYFHCNSIVLWDSCGKLLLGKVLIHIPYESLQRGLLIPHSYLLMGAASKIPEIGQCHEMIHSAFLMRSEVVYTVLIVRSCLVGLV